MIDFYNKLAALVSGQRQTKPNGIETKFKVETNFKDMGKRVFY